MRVLVEAWFTASVSLATGAPGQETTPEVETVVIEVPPIAAIAAPDTRSLVITLRLDLDHDQYLTLAELDTAIAELSRTIDHERHRARTQGWLDQSRARTASPGTMRSRPRPSMLAMNTRNGSRLRELRLVRQQVVAAGSELSLVSEDFHGLFSHLPPEQRHALLEADVAGNNDGSTSLREFYSHNRRVVSKETHFESDFGKASYLEVLRLLGVL